MMTYWELLYRTREVASLWAVAASKADDFLQDRSAQAGNFSSLSNFYNYIDLAKLWPSSQSSLSLQFVHSLQEVHRSS